LSFFDDIAALTQPQPTAGLSPQQQLALNLNTWGTNADVTGQLIGGFSHLAFGIQAKQGLQFQADQLRQNASDQQGAGQRTAFDEDRKTALVNSAALASAASSGGGASDPGVVNIMARTAGEGAYRRAVALYQGDDRARLMKLQADAKEYEGGTTLANSSLVAGSQIFNAGTSFLKGQARGASLYQRFGAGGPKASEAAPAGNTAPSNMSWWDD
jgi:hypothetical protein